MMRQKLIDDNPMILFLQMTNFVPPKDRKRRGGGDDDEDTAAAAEDDDADLSKVNTFLWRHRTQFFATTTSFWVR